MTPFHWIHRLFPRLTRAPRRRLGRRPGLEALESRLAPTGSLSVANASIVEGNSGQSNLVFTLTRGGDTSGALSVGYSTANDTATAGSDYLATSGRATFAAGATTATVGVPVLGDTTAEPNETFFFRLAGPSASFAAAAEIPAGRSPHEIEVADFNGDGKPDIVTANGDSALATSAAGVLLNTTPAGATTPTFSAIQEFAAMDNPYGGVAVGDFNGDGKPDVVVANYSNDSVSVLLNTTPTGAASASFASRVNFDASGPTTTGSPHQVAVGDINGDGKPDIVVAFDFGARVSVLLNTTPTGAATPSFSTAQLLSLAFRAKGLVVADLNGDGKPDIAAGSGNNNVTVGNVSVFVNTTPAGAGTATFVARQDFTANTGPVGLVAGDLNGDGKIDLAAASQSTSSVSVLLNTTAAGSTTLSFAANQSFLAGANSWDLTLADFTGDGKPDLATANFSGNVRVAVLVNTTATGSLTATFLPYHELAPFGGLAVAAADFTADGRHDLAVARFFTTGSVWVYPNTTATIATAQAVGTIVNDDSGSNTPPVLQNPGDRTVPSTQQVLSVTLSATDADGDPLTYSATAQSLAYVLDQQYALTTDGNFYFNAYGRNEKWVQGNGTGWYFLLSNGELYQWHGGVPEAQGTLLGNVGTSYYDDPTRLTSAPINQPRATLSLSGNVLTITRDLSWTSALVVTAGVSDGRGGSDSETFRVLVTQGSNANPVLQPISDRNISSAQQVVSVTLSATDADGDPLTYSATAQSLAYVLDQQYALTTDGNFYVNQFGRQEKWVQGNGTGWYFLLSNGELYQWHGGVPEAQGTLLGNVGTSYYDDPTRLTSAPINQPRATLAVSGNTLTITRDLSWISSIVVTAGVSDGRGGSDSKTFRVNVAAVGGNNPPVLQNPGDRTITAAQQPAAITLSATDADGDPITYSATAQSLAHVLDVQYGLFTDGNFYVNAYGRNEKWVQGSGTGWYFILPNGELYQWHGGVPEAQGMLLGNVGTSYYADPNLLVNAPINQPRATLSVSGNVLTITRDLSWVSSIVVTATASDGRGGADSEVFRITVTA